MNSLWQGALVALVAFALGVGWARLARDRAIEPSPTHEPPVGLGPAQLVHAVGGAITAEVLAATLMHQAAQGLTRLADGGGTQWVVASVKPTRHWRDVDPVSLAVGASLDIEFTGARFAVGRMETAAELEQARADAEAAAQRWFQGLLAPSLVGIAGAVAVWAALVAAVVLVFTAPVWALPFGAFALGGSALFTQRRQRRITEAGREVVAHGLGVQGYLDASGEPPTAEQYLAFLPYAYAFGRAEQWAERAKGVATAPPWCVFDDGWPGAADPADFAAIVRHAFAAPAREGEGGVGDLYAGWK